MLMASAFYYLRHGETDWNRARRIQGCSDIALNARGIAQAEAAREALRGCAIATICVSPLARARETARIVNQALERPIVVLDALRECSFGPYEGVVDPDWFASWRGGACATESNPMHRSSSGRWTRSTRRSPSAARF